MERVAKMAVAVSFGEFENALRRFDWTYTYSDDHSSWLRGEAQSKRIKEMAMELVLVDADKTVALYNKYARAAWGSEWKDIDASIWMDEHKYKADMKAYYNKLEQAVKLVSRMYGRLVSTRWSNLGFIGIPDQLSVEVRDDQGERWVLVMSGWQGGTSFDVYKGKGSVVASKRIDKYYSILDGLRPEEVSGAFGDLYDELVHRNLIQ